jgi:serine/threonine protein kinase
LETLIKKRVKLPEEEAIPIIRDFIEGFKHLGDAGFLHRDLKPANLLIKDKVTKIADFGFAKRVTANSK